MSRQANRGKVWEGQLDHYHARLQSSGRAMVTRNYPECVVRWARGKGIVSAQFRRTGAPDYTILSQGRTILADAKSTRLARWPLKLLEGHQANSLTAANHHGGLALLLINTPQGSYAVLWSLVRPLWERWLTGRAKRGEASLTHDQMVSMSVVWAPKGHALDYLQPALDHLSQRREVA